MRRSDLKSAFPSALVSTFAFVYIALPMAMLVQTRQQWAGAYWVLFVLLVVWAGDIFAYFVGRSVGRNLMSPRISPKKTWEGALASLAASLIVGILLYKHALPISSALLNAHLIERRDGLFAGEMGYLRWRSSRCGRFCYSRRRSTSRPKWAIWLNRLSSAALAQKIQARFCLVTEACLTELMPCSLPRRCCGTMRVGA